MNYSLEDFEGLPKTRDEALRVGSLYYFTGKSCKNGHLATRRVEGYKCIECTRVASREQNEKRKTCSETLTKHQARQRAYYVNNIEKNLWWAAKRRAKAKGLKFSIKVEDIIIPEKCPILGIELKSSQHKKDRNSPSVDRIDNNLGYVSGNIQVISDRANSMKNDASFEEIEKLYFYMKNLND